MGFLTKKRAYLATWVVVLYLGSLLAQFGPFSEGVLVAAWGFLIAGAVLVSSLFINWQSERVRRGHAIFLGALSGVYLLVMLGSEVASWSFLTKAFGFFVWWSLFLAWVYLVTGLFFKRWLFYYFSLVSFVSLPFYLLPSWQSFSPIFFALLQSALLIFAAV